MEYSIAVVDDNRDDIRRLTSAIKTFFDRTADRVNIAAFSAGEKFLDSFSAGVFQLVFMDICMDRLSGIETVKCLRKRDSDLLVVFLTSSEEYAFDAFPLHSFDYILKPYSEERLFNLLSEVLKKFNTKEPEISVRVPRAVHSVPHKNILAMLSQGHNVELRLSGGEAIKCLNTFAELSKSLEADDRFLPCNRGIMINMDYVKTIDNYQICLKDDSLYPIKVKGRTEVIAKFTKYKIRRMKEM